MPDKTLRDVLALAAVAEKAWLPKMHALRASGAPLNLEGDKTLLEELREQRSKLLNDIGSAIEARQTERTTFEARTDATDEDRSTFAVAETAFGEAHEQRKAALAKLDKRIDEAELQERRRADAAAASRGEPTVKSEPLTYRRDIGATVSYFRDLASMHRPGEVGDPTAARERIQRHAQEMEVEMPKRRAARERRAQAAIDRAERNFTGSFPGAEARGFDYDPFERRVNPNRTDGQGGFALPPLWLMDEGYVKLLRAGRVASALVRQMPLPEGTDSINVPKLAGGTITGPQLDGGAVPSQDFTDTAISAGVKTIAGQQDVALQLLDQQPGEIVDLAIMGDLAADYGRQIDRDVLYGPGGAAKITGIWPSTNWGATVVTSASAGNTGIGFFQTQGAMLSQLATSRFSLENVHFLFPPRRWFWYATQTDGASGTSGRPLIGSTAYAPYEVEGLHDGTPAEGLVGRSKLGPFNYYASANVPTTAAAASTVPDPTISAGAFDQCLAAKWDDLWLFEGNVRTRVLDQVLSGTLQIRFQLVNYVAFLARYGQSIVIAQGAGLPQPKGSVDTAMAY